MTIQKRQPHVAAFLPLINGESEMVFIKISHEFDEK